MKSTNALPVVAMLVVAISFPVAAAARDPQESADQPPQRALRVDPPPIATDKTVAYDYDIVYVRAPRVVRGPDGKDHQAEVWPDAGGPGTLRAPTDLMLLHPDGTEDLLVAGGDGAIADPYVSFDARSVYYTR